MFTLLLTGGCRNFNLFRDSKLYSNILEYNTATDTWCKVVKLGQAYFRSAMIATTPEVSQQRFNEKRNTILLIAGGLSSVDKHAANDDVMEVDLETGIGVVIGRLANRRFSPHLFFTKEHQLFVAGGAKNGDLDKNGEIVEDIEVVDCSGKY